MTAATLKAPRAMHPKSDVKYTGTEPVWGVQPTEQDRSRRLGQAFDWYGYHYGKKEVKEFILDWLIRGDRVKEAREFARVPDSTVTAVWGWLARISSMGLTLLPTERERLDAEIRNLIAASHSVKAVVLLAETPEVTASKPTIQDRLRDKMQEAAAELEHMYDDMILAGGRMNQDFRPMAVIRGLNVAPQMVGDIASAWRHRLTELEAVLAGRDAQLVEGYGKFTKLQIRSLIKFAEQVVSDCGSYVQIKKTERAPRKKKPISAEKVTQRFRYVREFAELKLTSEPVTKLVNCQEAWLYDTKKRKLIYVVADTHVGTMTVKGISLVGFDPTNSVQKTLRKPAEQIAALLVGGVAQHRKFFRDIRATEVRFNGRGNGNMVLLKIR